MAIWTFDFYIIPKNGMKKENFDELILWDKVNINDNSLKELALHLPKSNSWSTAIVQFGQSDETHLQLFYDKTLLQDISCSIDLRSVSIPTIKAIVSFIKNNDAVIFYENNFYEASMHNLINLLKQSNAFEFCKNPRVYIEKLAKDKSSKFLTEPDL